MTEAERRYLINGTLTQDTLVFGTTTLNTTLQSVSHGGDAVILPKLEFRLLHLLLSNPKRIFTRRVILDKVWGSDTVSKARTVDVHVGRLRKRFRDNDDFEIVTVPKLGYMAIQL